MLSKIIDCQKWKQYFKKNPKWCLRECNRSYQDCNWIRCDLCRNWFHPECVDMTLVEWEAITADQEWWCKACDEDFDEPSSDSPVVNENSNIAVSQHRNNSNDNLDDDVNVISVRNFNDNNNHAANDNINVNNNEIDNLNDNINANSNVNGNQNDNSVQMSNKRNNRRPIRQCRKRGPPNSSMVVESDSENSDDSDEQDSDIDIEPSPAKRRKRGVASKNSSK